MAGSNSAVIHFHNLHACMFCKSNTATSYSRNCSVSRKAKSQNFRQTVHRVCSKHTRTSAAARTSIVLHFAKLGFVDFTNSKTANRLKHIGQRKIFSRIRIRRIVSGQMSRHHRTARNKNSRQIKTRGSHKHTRNNFVAVRNHNQSIQLMSFCNTFNAVGNQFAGNKRIFHSFVSHRNAVAHTNGRKFNRSSASHAHTGFYSLGNTVKLNMSRNNFIFCTDNANQRLSKFFVSVTRSVKK